MFTRLQGYVKRRNANAAHYNLGLEAELLVLAGRHNEANMKFQAAVALASRSGFIHDAALISERFAQFLLRSGSNQEEEEALRLQQQQANKLTGDVFGLPGGNEDSGSEEGSEADPATGTLGNAAQVRKPHISMKFVTNTIFF